MYPLALINTTVKLLETHPFFKMHNGICQRDDRCSLFLTLDRNQQCSHKFSALYLLSPLHAESHSLDSTTPLLAPRPGVDPDTHSGTYNTHSQ